MPTPLIYQEAGFGPLDHIPQEEQWNLRSIYYITTRERDPNLRTINYGNKESDAVSVGIALIGFGGYDLSWSDLNEASKTARRPREIPLSIAGLLEAGRIGVGEAEESLESEGAANWLLNNFNQDIRDARDKDVLIYVHGARVDFYNACAFAAQIDHFMGRDMTSIAFSWPTRQYIAAYVLGNDVERGMRSARALARTIEIVAENSEARRINIVCWSAGGRVTTEALTLLADRHPDATAEELRERYRLGTVYYAASDVPRDTFIEALPKLNNMVRELVVTASANDEALKGAAILMGGSQRIGQIALDNPITPEQLGVVRAADRFSYVDLSTGSENRGFDITGHRYWFNHPWANTDMLLAVRTDLGPAERGLVQGGGPVHWIMPEDYPERIRVLIQDPELKMRLEDPDE